MLSDIVDTELHVYLVVQLQREMGSVLELEMSFHHRMYLASTQPATRPVL